MIKILDDLVEKWDRESNDRPAINIVDESQMNRSERCADELRAAIPVVEAELLRWKKAVEGLTPGGSEFVDNPEACAAYIQNNLNTPRRIMKLLAERKELVEALQSEITLLQAWARESREGGWSTHQVDPMNNRAKFLSSIIARVKGA